MADSTITTDDVRLRDHFSDLTTGDLNGLGLFDELMQTVKQHLLEEYSTQRVRGAEYSKVYLGSMEAALGNAVQYLLGIGTLDLQLAKLGKENELIDQQILLAKAQVEKVDAEIALINAQTTTETSLLAGRIYELNEQAKLIQEQRFTAEEKRNNELPEQIQLIEAQTLKVTGETALIGAKQDVEEKQIDVFTAQITQLQEQAKAFGTEVSVKYSKIQADAWSARAVANGDGSGGPNHWKNPE